MYVVCYFIAQAGGWECTTITTAAAAAATATATATTTATTTTTISGFWAPYCILDLGLL